MTSETKVEYAGAIGAAELALGAALTGEHRRRILAAGRQAVYAATYGPGRVDDAAARRAAGEAAAMAEAGRVVAEARPISGGAPAVAEAEAPAAALTLTIGGTPYAVRRVACPAAAALECFAVRKAGAAETHHVSRHADGCRCTCGDFVYRREHLDPKGCKHIRAMVAVGLLSYTADEAAAAASGGTSGEPPFPRKVRAGGGRPPSARASVLTDGPGMDDWAGGWHSA
jgi:hypothetical protein